MSMSLHSRVGLDELDEKNRFDFLRGVTRRITRIDELHPSKDNDTYYVFNIWVPEDEERWVVDMIERNIRRLKLNDRRGTGWDFRVNHTDAGLIIVQTWI